MSQIGPDDDIIVGFRWLATLDSRTCLKCAARDGLTYSRTGEPVGHNVPLSRGPGKIHRKCRCVLLPKLDGEYNYLHVGALRPSVDEDGAKQVLAELTYNEWFKERKPWFQGQVLGPMRHAVWAAHSLNLADLLDESGNPLKVAALFEKYGSPF